MNYKKLIDITLVVVLVLSVLGIFGIVFFSIKHPEIVSAKGVSAQDFTADRYLCGAGYVPMNTVVYESGYSADEVEAFIPLPDNYDYSRVEINNRQNDKKIVLVLPEVEDQFYRKNPIRGTGKYIEKFLYGYESNGVVIDIMTTSIVECSYEINPEAIYLKLRRPEEVYDRIVVVDPGHSEQENGTISYGVRECDVDLAVAKALKESLKAQGIGAYLTRNDGSATEDADKIALSQEVSANAIISIHCSGDAKTRITHGVEILYADEKSKAFCDVIYNALQTEIDFSENARRKNQADNIIEKSSLPAIIISVGYLTNKKDARQLTDEIYVQTLSDSLAAGIKEYLYK